MKKIFISVLALAVCACGIFDRESSNYWLNNIRNYSTYPIYYYAENEFDMSEKLADSKDFASHTYERNVEVSANVGQRMVDSTTYSVKKYTKNKILAYSDATISNTTNDIIIKKGQEFIPFGEIKIDNKYYMLIDGDGHGGILLIDENGHIMPSINYIYKGNLMLSRLYASVIPESVLIKQIDMTRTSVSDAKDNFKIIYNGSGNGYFDLIYVDYENSKGDAKKYTYMNNAKYIDVNGVKLEITGVYPDRIEYKILD